VTLLQTSPLVRRFGGVTALNGAEISINEGEIVSLIGPNGSGKTTFFNCLTGIYPPDSGEIVWRPGNCHLEGLPPHKVTRLGVARTFQNIRLFGGMSLLDNVMLAGQATDRRPALSNFLITPAVKHSELQRQSQAMDLLDLVGLSNRALEPAGSLPYGLQRRLEIARAAATRPKLLLLDEPCAGLNPQEIESLTELISTLRTRGFTILLIEHAMQIVMRISDRIVVFDAGTKIAEGIPREIQENPRVINAYLGVEGHA
jgi:branched-chain amino acid transport system ATP-binding protein